MMTRSPATASVSLTMTGLPIVGKDVPRVKCMSCNLRLELHQPDPESPERLLGICERCRNWYVLDLVQDDNEAVMVHIPEAKHLRKIGG